jgi:hypothetical protein
MDENYKLMEKNAEKILSILRQNEMIVKANCKILEEECESPSKFVTQIMEFAKSKEAPSQTEERRDSVQQAKD